MKNTQRPSIPLRTAAVLALAAVGVLGVPAAAVVVDEFTTNQATITQPPGGATTVATGGADILGQRRGLTAKLRDGAGPMTTGVASGKLSMAVPDTTPNSRGEAVVTWDGDNLPLSLSPTGLLGVDVTASDHTAFAFTVLSATAGSELVLDVHSNAGNASRGFLRLPTVAASTVFFLSYSSDFVPFRGAGADFTDVGAIVLTVRGTEATVELDKVETVPAALTVTKTDLTTPAGAEIGTTQQPPGTTFKYRVTITNTGGQALQLDLNDTIDANTTLSAATVRAGIAAIDDAYETPGNIPKSVGALEGLLANDVDPDQNGGGTELTVNTAGSPLATTLGGSVALSSDGSFTYTPPTGVGFAVDTFSYTVNDNDGQSATATAKIYLKRTVWFVDDDADVTAGPDGTGTFTDPFDALTQLSGVGGIDGADDLIFVHAGSYASGVVLDSGQDLIGEGSGLAIDLDTFVVAGTAPTINDAAGNGVTLNSDNTLMGFTVGNTPAASFDIAGTNFGTLIVGNVTLNGTGGALDLATGTLAAVFNSVISTLSNRAIRLNAAAGSLDTGSTTISNAALEAIEVTNGGSTYDFGPVSIIASAAGIDLASSATSTFTFDSLAVTTTAGAGLTASAAGTINLGGAGNTINATGGAAVDITSTSLGAGATFSNVTSSGSPGKGINLDGVTGSFSATGGSIGTATGIAVDINAGTGAISYAGGITNAAARAVEITGRTTSTVTLSGNISDGGTGVNIASNSGGTITLSGTYNGTAASSQIDVTSNSGTAVVNFSGSSKMLSTGASNAIDVTSNGTASVNFSGGGLVVTTTSGIPFNASGGAGGVTVQGSGNMLTSTTGTALSVVSTTIGASGLTFQKIAANGGTNGIVLSTTGTAGGLTVTGSGSAVLGGDDSGGIIQNTTGDAINLTSTHSTSLTNMTIQNVAGGVGSRGIEAVNITGSHFFKNGTITGLGSGGGADRNGIDIRNTDTNLTLYSIEDCEFSNSDSGTSFISAFALGTSSMRLDVIDSDFSDLVALAVQSSAGNTEGAVHTMTTNITGNTFRNASPADGQGGVAVTNTEQTATHNFTISGNTFIDLIKGIAGGNSEILLAQTTGGALNGTIANNILGNATAGNGDRRGIGVIAEPDVSSNGELGSIDIVIDGNTIDRLPNREAIFVDLREDTQDSELIIRNNVIGQLAGFQGLVGGDLTKLGAQREAIDVQTRGEVTRTLNLLLTGNNVRANTSANVVNLEVNIDNATPGNLTMHATVTGNTFKNDDAAGGAELIARPRDAGAVTTLCLDMNGNTLDGGAGQIDLNETGTLNVEQASAAALAGANGIPAGNVLITGTAPSFGVACMAPPT